MIKPIFVFLSLSLLTIPSFSFAENSVASIGDAFWEAYNSQNKMSAINNGTAENPVPIDDLSLQKLKLLAEKYDNLAMKAESISNTSLSEMEKNNLATLVWMLKAEADWLRSPLRRLTFNTVYSWLDVYQSTTLPQGWDAPDMRARYSERLALLPRYISQQQALLEDGRLMGVTQSCVAVDAHIDTVEKMLGSSPFLLPVAKVMDEMTGEQKEEINTGNDNATRALASYLQYVKTDYSPFCRKEAGIQAKDAYEKSLNYYTSTDVTAKHLHLTGKQEVERNLKRLDDIIQSGKLSGLVNVDSVEQLIAAMRTRPTFFAKDKDEIITRSNDVVEQVKSRMGDYFSFNGNFPQLHVVPMPDYVAEKAPAAYYLQGGDAGGTVSINTSNPTERNIHSLPALLLHEGLPGHHYQIYTKLQNKSVPSYRSNYYFQALTEGWGLYAEGYGEKLIENYSFLDQIGEISMELLRAGRLVVDTGIHTMGWSREQAVNYLTQNTAESDIVISNEVDRFISLPGQATTYKVGHLAIMAERSKSETSLGVNFNEKTFNDAVLQRLELPVEAFQKAMERWTEKQLQKFGR